MDPDDKLVNKFFLEIYLRTELHHHYEIKPERQYLSTKVKVILKIVILYKPLLNSIFYQAIDPYFFFIKNV